MPTAREIFHPGDVVVVMSALSPRVGHVFEVVSERYQREWQGRRQEFFSYRLRGTSYAPTERVLARATEENIGRARVNALSRRRVISAQDESTLPSDVRYAKMRRATRYKLRPPNERFKEFEKRVAEFSGPNRGLVTT